MGKRDVDNRWASFRAALQNQGVSVEGSVVFDVGCNAGMIMYSALTDGAAWAIGWDRPEVVTAAQRLLLSLGATRFDLLGEEISSATDFSFAFPQNENACRDSILFFLSMRKHIGFPDGIKDLPFEYVVYEDHDGVSMPSVKNYLEEMRDRWGLRVIHIGSHVDGEAQMERVVAILRRD